MKVGLVICGPDVAYGPLALLSGTFEEKVQKARDLGYDGVELMVRDPAELDWSHVKQTLAQAGLEAPQIVTGELFGVDGLCLITPDDDLYQRAVERTQAVIKLAAFLDCAIVNVGRLRGRLDWMAGYTDDPWTLAVERIAGIAAFAAAHNVPIALEPINRYEADFIANVDDGMRMVADVGAANLGLMLDLFHMNIEDASIENSLRAAGERCLHVHIADSNRRFPGAGHLDFDSIFATLADMGYQGYISAEIIPWPDPDTAAVKTIQYVRSHMNGRPATSGIR
ncbi:MAG: sugar phosphate isomerase/epimerase [Caldilineaceae bacterium]|nr:sugar phosphate isomerase/epimerase [Caldilineaceae bacterium]